MAQRNHLSNREAEVMKLLLQGKSNKLIASALGISERTVEFHLRNIYGKFQVSSRVELVLKLGDSTVAHNRDIAENRARPGSPENWVTSLKEAVSRIGKELKVASVPPGSGCRHCFTGDRVGITAREYAARRYTSSRMAPPAGWSFT